MAGVGGTAASPWLERYAGTLIGFLAGALVGLLFLWGAHAQGVVADPVRYFGLLPALVGFSLLLDWWQARSPRRGLAYLQRASLYWAVLFPLARLSQDLLAFAYYRHLDPLAELAEVFPAFASPGALAGFLLFQAVFGAAFGLGFGILARRLAVFAQWSRG
jgi:uncharacterized membrane protein